MDMKRNVIAALLALAMLVTSVAALTGGLAASADAITTRGDVSGDGAIDMKDVLLLRKAIAGLAKLTDETAADVNGDGAIDMKDVLLLRKYIANLDVSLTPLPGASEPTSDASSQEPFSQEPSSTEPSSADPTSSEPTVEDLLIPDQITMSFYDKDCTQYGLTWHTYTPSPNPVLQYVKGSTTDPADFADAMTAPAVSDHFSARSMPYDLATNTFKYANLVSVEDYCHKAEMKDLDFATEYSYRVGDADAGVWSAIATFTTRAETVDTFSFVNISDTQSENKSSLGYTYMRTALESAFAQIGTPAFILHTGDFVETATLHNLWRNMLNGNQDLLMQTPMMLSCGNHDSSDHGADYMQIHRFDIDVDTSKMDTKLGLYYSYDYGNAHIVVLNTASTSAQVDDTNDDASLDRAQYEWLKADLEANTKEWTFIAMHIPMFAPVGHGSDDEKPIMQKQLLKLFCDNHVDMVIQGHEHLYMRTYPMNESGKPIKDVPTVEEDGVTYLQDPDAPIFFMTGKTGMNGEGPYGSFDPSPFAKYGDSEETSYGLFRIEGNKLTVTANYTQNGQIKSYETFGIIHEK